MLRNAAPKKTKTFWAAIGSGLLLAAGAMAWTIIPRQDKKTSTAVAVPPELTVEALKTQTADAGRGFGVMREAMQRDDLTDEQRRQVAMNMRDVWQERMTERVNEYYDAPTEEDKNAILDRHIDEMQELRKEFEKRREELEKMRAQNEPRMREMFAQRTQQERKEQSESRNPDQMARGMAYFAAMQARAAQRGIQMPNRGPGGGPGGFRGRGP